MDDHRSDDQRGGPADGQRPDPYRIVAEVMAAYCSALDGGSPQDLRQLMHDEITLELPDTTHVGITAVMESYAGFFAARERTTRHHLTNVRVIEDRHDRIDAEAYLLAITEKAGAVSLASGTYRDELVRTGDCWLIARKRIGMSIPFTRVAPEHPT